MLRASGDLPAVRAAAPEVQRGLVALLADSQEATQELAARALSTLFDKCDAATQDTIVKELVSSLATTRTASAASSGGDMATFAELSDIANDAGQPELVYKLMELSTTSAVWNTRKGVAFALAGQVCDLPRISHASPTHLLLRPPSPTFSDLRPRRPVARTPRRPPPQAHPNALPVHLRPERQDRNGDEASLVGPRARPKKGTDVTLYSGEYLHGVGLLPRAIGHLLTTLPLVPRGR